MWSGAKLVVCFWLRFVAGHHVHVLVHRCQVDLSPQRENIRMTVAAKGEVRRRNNLAVKSPVYFNSINQSNLICTVTNHNQRRLKALCTEKDPTGAPEQARCDRGQEEVHHGKKPGDPRGCTSCKIVNICHAVKHARFKHGIIDWWLHWNKIGYPNFGSVWKSIWLVN